MVAEAIPLWLVKVTDDGTSDMAFIVRALMNVFNAELADASARMMDLRVLREVHFGPYPYDIAQTKAAKLLRLSDSHCSHLFAHVYKK